MIQWLKTRRDIRHMEDETKVLEAINKQDWTHGKDLHRATGLRAGRMYRALGSLVASGLTRIEWERKPPHRFTKSLEKSRK